MRKKKEDKLFWEANVKYILSQCSETFRSYSKIYIYKNEIMKIQKSVFLACNLIKKWIQEAATGGVP